MAVRRLAAGVCALALLLTMASASSLGTFADVALSGQAQPHHACTADADLIDPLGNVILLGGLLSAVTVDQVALSNIDGDCADVVPVVVTIGSVSGGAVEVLDVLDLTGRTSLQGSETAIDLDVLSSDHLYSLLDATVSVTEVRVAFCPVGATCT